MVSIKEISQKLGVSVQTIYNQIKRNTDLKEHVVKHRGMKFLDDYAEQYMYDNVHANSGIVLVEEQKEEQKSLHRTIGTLTNLIDNLQKENAELKIKNESLQLELTQTKFLEAKNEGEIKLLTEKNKSSEEFNSYLKEELDSYKPTIFGLYKKTKK